MVHEPALDGLRGVAVVAVVLFHLERLDGGFLGVDLFFVLSGYLITSLLLTEGRSRGAIDLARFWSRRARRLLPALVVMMAGVMVLLLRLTPQPVRARFRGDLLATLGYVANWHRMFASADYWDMFTIPSPLDHTWSLAIEEQFYLVWPLIVILVLGGRRRRRRTAETPAPGTADGAARDGLASRGEERLRWVALAGAAVSFALLAWTYAPGETNRAYFGSDTRIGASLLGAALATWAVQRPRQPAPPPRLERAGWAALAVIGWMFVTTDGQSPWYYRGGLALFALVSLVVITAVSGRAPGRAARVLSVRPLRWLGTVSYGVYLWHWPIIVFFTEEHVGVRGIPLDVLRVALTLAAAWVSYVVVERPIRSGALTGRRIRQVTAGTLVVIIPAALFATSGTPLSADQSDGPIPVNGSTNPFLLYPSEIPPGAPRMLLVGDSGVAATGPAVRDEAERHGMVVATSSVINCAVLRPEGKIRSPNGDIDSQEPCHEVRQRLWRRLVEEFRPDVVVYYLANAGLPGDNLLDGEWVNDCDPSYDRYLARTLEGDAAVLQEHGASLVFTTTPQPAVLDARSRDKVACRNQTYADVAASLPDAGVIDLASVVDDNNRDGIEMFEDPVHLSRDGSELAAEWMIPLVLARISER
jgi:peptidoglycan/LPS O-acetylase OafA/YrhL/lysophospholipase L1-like esterase